MGKPKRDRKAEGLRQIIGAFPRQSRDRVQEIFTGMKDKELRDLMGALRSGQMPSEFEGLVGPKDLNRIMKSARATIGHLGLGLR